MFQQPYSNNINKDLLAATNFRILYFLFVYNIVSSTHILAGKQTYSQEELIILIREKNQKAFSFLYDNYSKALLGVIHSVVSDMEEAEDVLQKTFLKIWTNFDSYDTNKGRLYTWMLNIARNLAIDSTRSKHEKIKSRIRSTSDNVYKFERNLYAKENTYDTIGLNNIINSLKEDHKSIIHLAYFEGHTQEEISEKLNLPLGTVKTKVRQALLILRELIKKETIN